MNAVAPVTPTATEPSQMNAPKKSPQRNETTPWAIEGGRRWDTSGPYRLAHPGFPQAARSAVEMWKIEFSANCGLDVFRGPCTTPVQPLDSHLRRARSPSRSKPNLRTVPGREKSARAVDERETGSANSLVQDSFGQVGQLAYLT